jgi:hypothetical protein
MFSSPTLSHLSFSIILLQAASYSRDLTSMRGMSMWYILLVPFFIMMVVLGCQNTNDDEEELEVCSTYHGKEEEIEGDDDNENDSDDGQEPKESSTPLWKYVTKIGGGRERRRGSGWNHKIYMLVGSRPKWKARRFWERRHARGKRQLEGRTTHVHAWKT